MRELNLSIYTGSGAKEGENKVTMTASFDNHEQAVRFHEGIAKLCRDASAAQRPTVSQLIPKMIGR